MPTVLALHSGMLNRLWCDLEVSNGYIVYCVMCQWVMVHDQG